MKVYVDEKPKNCVACPCESDGWCNLEGYFTDSIDIKSHCPLQSLSDYTKQVRKEVYDYVLDRLGNIEIENNTDYNSFIAILNEILDQIQ